MIIIEFRALTLNNYRTAILLIILAILIPVSIFMFLVISNNIINLGRAQIVFIMGLSGIISFLLLGLITQKGLSKYYELAFRDIDLLVTSEKTETIPYIEIESIVIRNNSDYSNVTVHKIDGNRIKFFVGMANLLNNKNILQPTSLLDAVLQKNFKKEINNHKGVDTISYERRHLA